MAEPDQSQREKLYEAIQASINEREDLEGSVLLSFVIVAEWKDPDSNSWLTKLSGDSFSELPPWRERMFGQELLNWDVLRHADICDKCGGFEEPPEEEELF